jgi:hypothetical protein
MTAVVNLPWRGAETIAAANSILAARGDVEVQLPAGYHHAVVAHFQKDVHAPGTADRVDVAGGIELLEVLSTIRGLDDLAKLEAVAQQTGARIRVMSPSPTVVIRASEGDGV